MALITVNRTDAPGMNALAGKTFTVAKDSFLIENACIKEYSTEHCSQLQVAGGYFGRVVSGTWVEVKLPASLADFEANPTEYDGAYVSTTLFGKTRHDIVAMVPKGSRITVTRLVSKAWGESGRCWVVYGRMVGQPDNMSIEIPACGIGLEPETRPLWFTYQKRAHPVLFVPEQDAYDLPPEPKSEYLILISSNSPA